MPRSIIDVESSRPRFVRRRLVLWAVVVLVALLVAYVAAVHARHAPLPVPVPGKSALQYESGAS